MDNISNYFSGEKTQCTAGILLALLSILLAAYFIYTNNILLKGIAVAFILPSLLLLAICVGIVWRTPNDILRVSSYYKSEPSKLQTEELPRMQKVMKTFPIIKTIEVCIFVAGVLLVLFFGKNNLLAGIGIGLAIQGAALYTFDHFAEARGKVYTYYLSSL